MPSTKVPGSFLRVPLGDRAVAPESPEDPGGPRGLFFFFFLGGGGVRV